jgi:hypothetical protein
MPHVAFHISMLTMNPGLLQASSIGNDLSIDPASRWRTGTHQVIAVL